MTALEDICVRLKRLADQEMDDLSRDIEGVIPRALWDAKKEIERLRSRQGECPSGTTSEPVLQQPRKPGESPALLTSKEQVYRAALELIQANRNENNQPARDRADLISVAVLAIRHADRLPVETRAEPIDGRDRIEQCVREIQQICDWGNMDASEWLNDETAIGEKPRERPQPIATVIDNNQPGWTNIIETAPNVSLPVGTKLYDQNALLAVGARVVDEIWQRESSEKSQSPDCATCNDTGEIDETLGGLPTSNPCAPCPDCRSPGGALKSEAPLTTEPGRIDAEQFPEGRISSNTVPAGVAASAEVPERGATSSGTAGTVPSINKAEPLT